MFDFITIRLPRITPWYLINGSIVTSVTLCYGSSASHNICKFFENFKFFLQKFVLFQTVSDDVPYKTLSLCRSLTLSVTPSRVIAYRQNRSSLWRHEAFKTRYTVSTGTVKTYWTSFVRWFTHISWPGKRFVKLYYRLEICLSWKSLKTACRKILYPLNIFKLVYIHLCFRRFNGFHTTRVSPIELCSSWFVLLLCISVHRRSIFGPYIWQRKSKGFPFGEALFIFYC